MCFQIAPKPIKAPTKPVTMGKMLATSLTHHSYTSPLRSFFANQGAKLSNCFRSEHQSTWHTVFVSMLIPFALVIVVWPWQMQFVSFSQ